MFYFVTSSDFNVFSSFESLRPPEKTATLTWSCCRPQESLAEPPQPLFLWCNFLLSCWRAVSWDLNTNLLVLLSAEPERTPHCSECVCVCVCVCSLSIIWCCSAVWGEALDCVFLTQYCFHNTCVCILSIRDFRACSLHTSCIVMKRALAFIMPMELIQIH